MTGKVCPKCKLDKPVSEYARNKNGSDGLQSCCKDCFNERQNRYYADPANRERRRLSLHDRYHNHPEGYKAHLKSRYGITVEDYNRMLAEQGGVCAICSRPPHGKKRRLAVDHNHETGEVRRLLCLGCNKAIGFADENVERLSAMIDYLKRHESGAEPVILPCTFVA